MGVPSCISLIESYITSLTGGPTAILGKRRARVCVRTNEVIFLSKPLFVVSSVTYAMKSKELLFRRGIRAYVERIPPENGKGCGYGVYVPEGADSAEAVLRENGIKILGRMEQEDGP